MAQRRRLTRAIQDRLPNAAPREMTAIAAVLLAIVGVAAGLAYQAQVASRANVETARHALSQYSSVVAWQFVRSAQREMQSAADVTIGHRVQRALQSAANRRGDLVTPAELRAASEHDCNCQTPLRVDRFFRWDVGSTDILVEGQWPEAERHALAARLAADARDPAGDRHLSSERLATAADSSTDHTLARWSHANCDLLVDTSTNGTPRLLAVIASYDSAHRLRALYGAVAPITEAPAVFTRALKRESLLPTALLSAAAQDSAIGLSVAAGGHEIFSHGPATHADFVARDSLGSATFAAVVHVGLRADVADRLLIGGLPRSRRPMIAVLLALSLVLLGIALRQMHRAAELARLRSDFVASVSHELRTPLSLVRVYTETLIDDPTVDREQHGRFLGVILKETTRLGRLVDNLLRFADLERRSITVTATPTDLGAVVNTALADFRPLAESADVSLDGRIACGLMAVVDGAALRQMLFNLLSNSVKFGGAGTRIVVALEQAEDRARITVDDAGPGIPTAHRRRVFDRYVRLADVGTGGPAGSGIGLAIVRELAHAQGMSVWIDSAPLGGTRVVLSMPLISSEAPGDEPVAMTGANAGPDIGQGA